MRIQGVKDRKGMYLIRTCNISILGSMKYETGMHELYSLLMSIGYYKILVPISCVSLINSLKDNIDKDKIEKYASSIKDNVRDSFITKMKYSDCAIVYNKDNYIGKHVEEEINICKEHGIPVYYITCPNEEEFEEYNILPQVDVPLLTVKVYKEKE